MPFVFTNHDRNKTDLLARGLLRPFQTCFGITNVVLFPEIGRVKIFYHSPVCIVEFVSKYIFLIKTTTTTTTTITTTTTTTITATTLTKTRSQKREYLQKNKGNTIISFTNLFSVLLTYLIESIIPPACSYEFNGSRTFARKENGALALTVTVTLNQTQALTGGRQFSFGAIVRTPNLMSFMCNESNVVFVTLKH